VVIGPLARWCLAAELEVGISTLQATALVHKAYLRLVGEDADAQWGNRGHFFAAAAEAMRRILGE
jgi:ECF sigma factor